MPGSRKPGSLGLNPEVKELNDGTMIRALSPHPGLIGTEVPASIMPFLFLKQSHTGPDSNLCGFFALYHFTNGNVTRDQYLTEAAKLLVDLMGVSLVEAKAMAADGNDPATYGRFGLHAGNRGAVDKFEVLIVCNIQGGHFFTIRKEGGQWWNYDSYNYNRATLIGDNDAAKAVCGDNPVYYS